MSSDDASASDVPTPQDTTPTSLRIPTYEKYYVQLRTDNQSDFIISAVEQQIENDGVDLETWNVMVEFLLKHHDEATPDNLTEIFDSPEELLSEAQRLVNQKIDATLGAGSNEGDPDTPDDDEETTT